jgi:prevent-host-death family protein
MARINIVQARKAFARTVNRAAFGGERIVLERYGEEVAALVPIEDLRRLEELEDREDLREARRVLANPDEKPLPYEQVRRELGLDETR